MSDKPLTQGVARDFLRGEVSTRFLGVSSALLFAFFTYLVYDLRQLSVEVQTLKTEVAVIKSAAVQKKLEEIDAKLDEMNKLWGARIAPMEKVMLRKGWLK